MLESILQLDLTLFWLINDQLSNDYFDVILPIARAKTTWIPVYAFICFFTFFNKKFREALLYILILLVVILLCDNLSSSILKPIIARLRPCNNPDIYESVNLLVHCGTGYSLPSSHATNHFGLSMFLYFGVVKESRILGYLLIVWAAVISLAQVYVGLHFPLDVLIGGLLGSVIGYVFYKFYKFLIRN